MVCGNIGGGGGETGRRDYKGERGINGKEDKKGKRK